MAKKVGFGDKKLHNVRFKDKWYSFENGEAVVPDDFPENISENGYHIEVMEKGLDDKLLGPQTPQEIAEEEKKAEEAWTDEITKTREERSGKRKRKPTSEE